MRTQQKGFTLSGFIMGLVVVLMVAMVAIKVVPMYMEFRSVKSAMDALTKEEFESGGDVRESLNKRLSMNYVETLENDDISIKSKNNGYEVSVDYYVEKPLVGNLALTAHFEYSVATP